MQETELYIRVKQALTWLKRKGVLQKNIAKEMGMAEASFTRGLSRIKEKRDEDFVIKFHSAVSKFISLDYLLYGNGDMLIDNNKDEMSQPTLPPAFDLSIYIENAVKAATAYADQTISALRSQLVDKDKLISAKDVIIESLNEKIKSLEHTIAINSLSDIEHYPFHIGAADGENEQQRINHI